MVDGLTVPHKHHTVDSEDCCRIMLYVHYSDLISASRCLIFLFNNYITITAIQCVIRHLQSMCTFDQKFSFFISLLLGQSLHHTVEHFAPLQ